MRKIDTHSKEELRLSPEGAGTAAHHQAPGPRGVVRPRTVADARSQPACTIVLVDDDEDLVASLREVLEEENFEVETFTDAREALERLKRGAAPDVLLVDFLMPQMDGVEFLGACEGAGLHVPAVLFTAMSDIGPKPRGATSVLRKPFELDALLCELGRVRNAA